MIEQAEIITEDDVVKRIALCAGVPDNQASGFVAGRIAARDLILRHARIQVQWPPELRTIEKAVKRQRRDFDPDLQRITARMEYNPLGYFTMDVLDYLFFFPGVGVEEIARHDNADGYLTVRFVTDYQFALALACSALAVYAASSEEPGSMQLVVTGVFRDWGRVALGPDFAELMEKLSALPAYPARRVNYWKGVLDDSKIMPKMRRSETGQ